MITPLLLGLLQGIFEWIPISSEGALAVSYSFLLNRELDEAVKYALWLHIATVPSVIVVFRNEFIGMVREILSFRGHRFSPLLRYLVISTIFSCIVGIPIIVSLHGINTILGLGIMGFVGISMMASGAFQLISPVVGTRKRSEVTDLEAVFAGIVQGFTVIPGISRSGTTVAFLLARRFDHGEALVISYIMGVPISFGGAIYIGLGSGFFVHSSAFISVIVAFVTGIFAIRIILNLAKRINFGLFVIVVGITMVMGAVWQMVT